MFGQRRPRMAVLVHLATDNSGALERSKVRLANASERLLPQACQGGEGGGHRGSAAVPARCTAVWVSSLRDKCMARLEKKCCS